MSLRGDSFDPSLWFLAYDERSTEIAGVALNLYHQDSNTGWVDHLGVRRPWRKKELAKHCFCTRFVSSIDAVSSVQDSLSIQKASLMHRACTNVLE